MKNTSIWINNQEKSSKTIKQDMEVDVLIIGGGITGLSSLLELQNSNLKTILVERNTCGYGVTSRSTAKITYLQEQIFMNIRKTSYENASLYLASQIEAVNRLKNIVHNYHIDCDLKKVSSYLFTNEEENVAKLEDEYNFLSQNHVKVKKTKLEGIDNILALQVDDTYTFHPLKYINHLKAMFSDFIYENSKVTKIDKKDGYYYSSVNNRQIKSKYIVLASHYPYFLIPFLMPFKSHVETSYIGAKRVKQCLDISAINIDKPCISMRYYDDGNDCYLIYLYQSFATCNIKSIKDNFDELKKQQKFDYLWSNKDIITNDYIPYIGRIYKNDDTFLIATGYNTWGMTNGTLAGMICADIILKRDNPYTLLFSPHRNINLNKIVRLPIDLGCNLKAIIKSTKGNVNNSKVIYTKKDGKNVAIYKDEKEVEHIVLNKCPHMKCGLVLNEVEKTWDCLCHGSRFTLDGKCIEGPSNFDIRFK